MTIAFRYKNLGIVAVEEPNRRSPALAIRFDPAVKLAPKVAVAFESAVGSFTLTDVAYNAAAGRLEGFSEALMNKVMEACTTRFGPENVNPPVDVKLTATIVLDGKKVEVADGLTVKWVRVDPDPLAPLSVPLPKP